MARGALAIIGTGVASLIAALTLLPLGAVFLRAGDWPGFGPGDGDAVVFTVGQAIASAALSCLLAIPVARALARRRFLGRGALIALMGAPFILPVIVAILGLVAVFGRSGLANDLLRLLGLPDLSIYGVGGVVLAHVFLNLPLAVRMLLHGWQAIPAERFRLAEALGLGPGGQFRHLEWPMLREVLPGAFVVIFVLCLTSFAVALTLGGGPRATTVELAIYQAVKFDFDLGRAGLLAAVQFVLCLVAAALGWKWAAPSALGVGLGRQSIIPAMKGWRRWADGLAIAAAAAFLIIPLAAVAMRGASGLLDLPEQVWAALGRSIGVAVASGVLTMAAALTLALATALAGRCRRAAMIELAAMLPLATSALVLGIGLFILIRPFALPSDLALGVTVAVNALLTLPFAYRLILPQARALIADYGRLSSSLDLRGWSWLRWVALPQLARPVGFGAGLSLAFSMGDLGVIALFAGDQTATLPLVVQRLMSAYRIDQAMSAALLLVIVSFALFWACDAWGRRHAAP